MSTISLRIYRGTAEDLMEELLSGGVSPAGYVLREDAANEIEQMPVSRPADEHIPDDKEAAYEAGYKAALADAGAMLRNGG